MTRFALYYMYTITAVVSQDESPPTRVHENVDAYFKRMKETLQWLGRKLKGNIVIAAHLATGAITRTILERPEVTTLSPGLLALYH